MGQVCRTPDSALKVPVRADQGLYGKRAGCGVMDAAMADGRAAIARRENAKTKAKA
jgi:hypothetical protein